MSLDEACRRVDWRIVLLVLAVVIGSLDIGLDGKNVVNDVLYKSVLVFLFEIYAPLVQPQTIFQVLRAFLTAKASLIAIIFSVLFVATQLVSSRYSPDFISIFTDSRLVKYTFYFAVFSLLFDLSIVVLSSALPNDIEKGLFAISLCFSAILIGGIYPFMNRVLQKSTPIELLNEFQKMHSLDGFISKAINSAEENTTARHSLHPIYDLVRNAMEREESAVALEGERKIFEISQNMTERVFLAERVEDVTAFRDRYENEDLSSELKRLDVLFGPVVDQYLSEVAVRAIDDNYDDIYTSSVSHIGELGVQGSGYSEYFLGLYFDSIYNNIIRYIHDLGIPDTRKETLLDKSVEEAMRLFTRSVEIESFEWYHRVLSLIYEVMRISHNVDPEMPGKKDKTTEKIFQAQIDCYEMVVNKNEEYLQDKSFGMDDLLGTEDSGIMAWSAVEHNDPRISVLINSRVTMMATAAHQIPAGKDPEQVPTFLVLEKWEEFTILATKRPPRASGLMVAQRFIEMIVYISMASDSDTAEVMPYIRLSNVMKEGNYELIEQAFAEILTTQYTRHDFVKFNSFRSLPRSLIWSPFPYYDYDSEFYDTMYRLRGKAKEQIENEMRQEISNATTEAILLKNHLLM